jgi:hypothetical protein
MHITAVIANKTFILIARFFDGSAKITQRMTTPAMMPFIENEIM